MAACDHRACLSLGSIGTDAGFTLGMDRWVELPVKREEHTNNAPAKKSRRSVCALSSRPNSKREPFFLNAIPNDIVISTTSVRATYSSFFLFYSYHLLSSHYSRPPSQ